LPFIELSAKVHEQAGFDRVLVAFHSSAPDSTMIAAHIAYVAPKLHLMIAHRPGFVSPTVAARQLATLDQLTRGRVGVHIISGGDDEELKRDGDFLTKEERYERTGEYLDVVKRVWTSEEPFDHAGKHYHFERAYSQVRPLQDPHIPIYFGGASDAAIKVAGKHADIYALWGETYAQVRELTTRVKAEAFKHGRQIRFSLSLRPIIAATEEAAWKKADTILETAQALIEKTGFKRNAPPANEGSLRLLEAARKGIRLDKRLWTGLAALTGAKGNSTSLVGTPEQVADALLDYRDLGVSTFLIRGFDPIVDAEDYGKVLIPLTRALVAARGQKIAAWA
jgi:alkanesulfonate monooxygenase